ncbi:PREDICTED: putative olfactory receptor 52P1 [Thamnophis sirtalis]|uniref:Olfactory receptor n=1 Tax=Thamnophis sirtalis TaxID=35019 RepID=A0A6I9Z4S9_9SAUR|nr:PREDICTED: putative olfactory receptor 52P1 [Thamnophis sirtalis]
MGNLTYFWPSFFVLQGVPGLEVYHMWFSGLVCTCYGVIIAGNCMVLLVIVLKPALHKPMYYFLCMLSMTELITSTSTLPKMLSIFWFQAGEIQVDSCLAQMFFIHASGMVGSAVLLAMAVDRYVAICFPLRYNSFFTGSLAAKMGVAAVVRATLLMCPCPFLIKRLTFCRTNVIHHTYCEHMAVVRLACGDTRINSVYGLSAALVVIGGDLLGIGLSYFFIVRAVLRLSSNEEHLRALNTCISLICAVLTFYMPMIGLSMIHCYGENAPLVVHILMAKVYLLALPPPLMNPVVYSIKAKPIRMKISKVLLRRKDSVRDI